MILHSQFVYQSNFSIPQEVDHVPSTMAVWDLRMIEHADRSRGLGCLDNRLMETTVQGVRKNRLNEYRHTGQNG